MRKKLSLGLGSIMLSLSSGAMAAVMPLEQYVTQVLTLNDEIAYQRLGADIARESITVSEGEFDTRFNASLTRTDTFVKNTASELLQRLNKHEYESVDDNIRLALEKKARFGTEFEVSYNIERMNNSLQAQAERGQEVSSYLGINVTQPLWKNFGTENNTFAQESSRLDSSRADYDVDSRRSSIAREAVHAYLDAQKNAHIMATRKEAVKTAKKLLDDTIALVQQGRLAEYDAIDIRAALALRYAEFSVAEQEYLMALHRVKRLLPSKAEALAVQTQQLPEITAVDFDLESAVTLALGERPDVVNARLQVEKEKLQFKSVDNANKPDLNLIVSYGLNGLDKDESSSLEDAADGKYRTWSAGVEFSMPLGSDKGSSERRAAILKQQQAETALTVLHRQVAVDLSQSYEIVQQLYRQLGQYQQILKGQQERMQIDRDKAKQGKISYMELIRRRDTVNEAQENYVRKLFDYQKAKYDLYFHQGALLDNIQA